MNEEHKESGTEDEEPEDISHAQAKNAARERQQREKESILKQKIATKEIRRKRQNKLTEQKESRREKQLEKLPEEIINILSAVDANKEDVSTKLQEGTSPVLISKSSGVGREIARRQNQKRKTKKEISEPSSDEDEFKEEESIAIEEGSYGAKSIVEVCTLKQLASKESKAGVGKNFLRDQLYGKRIKRVDSSSLRNSCALKVARPKANF